MKTLTTFAAALALTAAIAFAQNNGVGGIPSPLKITVSGYSDGGDIPDKYTCAAKPPGGSPQIEWSGAPEHRSKERVYGSVSAAWIAASLHAGSLRGGHQVGYTRDVRPRRSAKGVDWSYCGERRL
jgi:hypothetical protein